MGTKRDAVYNSVNAELDYAEAKWGTAFDDKNTLNDWATYANIYLAKATDMHARADQVEQGLIKAIGLLTNALIRFRDGTLAPRHYDNKE